LDLALATDKQMKRYTQYLDERNLLMKLFWGTTSSDQNSSFAAFPLSGIAATIIYPTMPKIKQNQKYDILK
jgi:hypothetical protein